ncbi:hypothetical protein BD309DRAFT_862817, partial [Dichomitus squalens]
SRLNAFAFVALPILTPATPLERSTETARSCCATTMRSGMSVRSRRNVTPSISKELGILLVVVQKIDTLIGLTCSTIIVVSVSSSGSRSANAVCREENSHIDTCVRCHVQTVTYAYIFPFAQDGTDCLGCVPVDL